MRMKGNVFKVSTHVNHTPNGKWWDRDESDHRGHDAPPSVVPEDRKIGSAKAGKPAFQKFVDSIKLIAPQQPGNDEDTENSKDDQIGDLTFHGGRRHLHARRLPAMITADSEVRMCQRCTTDGNSWFLAMRTLQPPTPQRSQRLSRLLLGCWSFVGIFHVTILQKSGYRSAPSSRLLRWQAQSRRSFPLITPEDPDRRYD